MLNEEVLKWEKEGLKVSSSVNEHFKQHIALGLIVTL